jgi:signal transduction histidine kinase/CheY-like chemotaxis protein
MIVLIAQYPWKKRLLLGVALAVLVLVAQQGLTIAANGRLTFLLISTFLPFVTVLFGPVPGLILLAGGMMFGAYWLSPLGSLAVESSERMVLLIYVIVGSFLVIAGARLSAVARRAGRAEDATREAEKKLLEIERESRKRFDLALDTAGVPFCVLAPVFENDRITDFRWEYLNEAAVRFFLPSPATVIGSTTSEVIPRGWDRAAVVQRLAPLARNGGKDAFDLRVQTSDGERWYHVVIAALDGSVVAWLGDVTPRVRAERALSEADRRKDEFLATLAHELRNPLGPIRQVVEILEQPGLTDDRRSWCISVLRRQTSAMALLLDDLLDVSRITRGALKLRKDSVGLSEVISDAVEVAKPVLEGKAHVLRVSLPERPVYVEADRLRLAQVLANLLTNAVKYTPAGGDIELSAAVNEEEIVLSVKDSGIGIEPDKLSAIFSMFAQIDPDNHEGGLGIGLALSKNLIELHGGRISVESDGRGKGSRFTIHLPAECKVVPDNVRGAPTGLSAHIKRRILIVDDNVDAADAMATLIEMEGHMVRIVYSGEEAVAVLDHFTPEVVLLDLGLPGMSGIDVALQFRRMPLVCESILVAITGRGEPHDREQTAAAGFDFHFTKPVDAAQLFGAIQSPINAPQSAAGGKIAR